MEIYLYLSSLCVEKNRLNSMEMLILEKLFKIDLIVWKLHKNSICYIIF